MFKESLFEFVPAQIKTINVTDCIESWYGIRDWLILSVGRPMEPRPNVFKISQCINRRINRRYRTQNGEFMRSPIKSRINIEQKMSLIRFAKVCKFSSFQRSSYAGKSKGSDHPRPRKANLRNFRCTLSIRRLCTSKFGDQIHDPYSKTERTQMPNRLSSKHTDQWIPFQIAWQIQAWTLNEKLRS
jgi:hypothetical protein